jgi:hypothetical protein
MTSKLVPKAFRVGLNETWMRLDVDILIAQGTTDYYFLLAWW